MSEWLQVCDMGSKTTVYGSEERIEECSWSSMLLVLIGPYFNHSHWSVSSLTEQILFLPLPSFLPLRHATLVHPLFLHTHTHTETHAWTPLRAHSLTLLSSICVFFPIVHSFIHTDTASPRSAASQPNTSSRVFLLALLHSLLPHKSYASFTPDFLPSLLPSPTCFPSFISPSLSRSFSLFDPCWVEEPPGRRAALVPIVHSVQSDRQAAQRAAGSSGLCMLLLHGCKYQ